MLWVAVCDDEVMECCKIAGKIKVILKEMNIPCMIRQFCSGQELIQSSDNFDIIFLDIIMRDLDGMRTAHIFREKAFEKILIFISSSREYVFEAYDVEAFQYLLKPIDEKKLKKVLQKAVLKIESHSQEFIIVSKERQKKEIVCGFRFLRGSVNTCCGSMLFFSEYRHNISEPYIFYRIDIIVISEEYREKDFGCFSPDYCNNACGKFLYINFFVFHAVLEA